MKYLGFSFYTDRIKNPQAALTLMRLTRDIKLLAIVFRDVQTVAGLIYTKQLRVNFSVPVDG